MIDWDSYWIVLGLLCVEMIQTAKHMVKNLVDLVHRYNFVPNGKFFFFFGVF